LVQSATISRPSGYFNRRIASPLAGARAGAPPWPPADHHHRAHRPAEPLTLTGELAAPAAQRGAGLPAPPRQLDVGKPQIALRDLPSRVAGPRRRIRRQIHRTQRPNPIGEHLIPRGQPTRVIPPGRRGGSHRSHAAGRSRSPTVGYDRAGSRPTVRVGTAGRSTPKDGRRPGPRSNPTRRSGTTTGSRADQCDQP
jgi:hypothetical protein